MALSCLVFETLMM